MPQVRRPGPVRRQLRGLRRKLLAQRAQEPEVGGLRGDAGAARVGALFLPPRRLRGHAQGVDPRRRAAERGRQQARRVVRRRAAGVGHLPRRPLLRLRDSRIIRASSSTSGSTPPSATWRASRTCATAPRGWSSTTSGPPRPRRRSTTSSARTSSTSTPCSGPPCSTARTSAPRRRCSPTASSRWTGRRCPSPAAPSSRPAPISTTSTRSTCATTSPPSWVPGSTTSTSTWRTSPCG